MNLITLPAFADNDIWMLHDGVRAVVVDPEDAAPVQAAPDRLHLQLISILVTHPFMRSAAPAVVAMAIAHI